MEYSGGRFKQCQLIVFSSSSGYCDKRYKRKHWGWKLITQSHESGVHFKEQVMARPPAYCSTHLCESFSPFQHRHLRGVGQHGELEMAQVFRSGRFCTSKRVICHSPKMQWKNFISHYLRNGGASRAFIAIFLCATFLLPNNTPSSSSSCRSVALVME